MAVDEQDPGIDGAGAEIEADDGDRGGDVVDVVEGGENAPVQIFSRHRRDQDKVEIKPYDFKRPERISKDQMRALQTLHEAFARNFGASLSGFLRTIVEVNVAQSEQMTYQEFITSLPNPTCFSLIHCKPLEGLICLEVSPLIVYPVIDRLMGGGNKDLFMPQRPMTAIESRLVRRLLERGMQVLSEAWASVFEFDFALGEMESNSQLVQIVPPNEVVAVIGFEIKLGNRAGTMSLCIPYNTIEPIIQRLDAQSWHNSARRTGGEQARQRLSDRLSAASMLLEATLARTTITMRELRDLQVGDLITTGKPANEPIDLSVRGRTKFHGRMGRHKGRIALRIESRVEIADRRAARSDGSAGPRYSGFDRRAGGEREGSAADRRGGGGDAPESAATAAPAGDAEGSGAV